MIAEVSASHKANDLFRSLARQITGRSVDGTAQKNGSFSFTKLSKMLKRA